MKKWLLITALAVTASCQMVRKLSDGVSEWLGDEVVARAGAHKLFRSDLEKALPEALETEDSLALSRQYIYNWAEELLLLDMAEAQLSKNEKDVSKELEDYRRSLLRYRYEEHYVSERMDTAVTAEQMLAYYEEHPEKFSLERTVFRCRILIIPSGAKSLKAIRKLMVSEDPVDVAQADSLSRMVAIRFMDASERWMDSAELSREAGMEMEQLVPVLKKGGGEWTDEEGNLHFVHLVERIPEGKTAPFELVSDRIRDILLNSRKHSLTSGLERDLLERARTNGSFVIY